MNAYQALRYLCALIVTAVLRWLSNLARRPAILGVLAFAAAVAYPVQAVFVSTNAVQNVVIDGFTMRGNTEIHSAQVQFLDCVFDARQGAPLRCGGESDVIIWRGRLSEGARKLPARCVAVEGGARVFLAESRDAVSVIGCD